VAAGVMEGANARPIVGMSVPPVPAEFDLLSATGLPDNWLTKSVYSGFTT